MKLYVVGASAEAPRAASWIQKLEAEGLSVTYDWTKPVLEHGSVGQELTQVKKRFFARADLRAIEEASVLWVLTPRAVTIGAWLEMGYALRDFKADARRFIVLSPPASPQTIFAELQKCVEFDSDEEAFEHIVRLG